MRADQLRLWFASMGYVLICALRRIGLRHPKPFTEAVVSVTAIEQGSLTPTWFFTLSTE
jgi:hypothetical protein